MEADVAKPIGHKYAPLLRHEDVALNLSAD